MDPNDQTEESENFLTDILTVSVKEEPEDSSETQIIEEKDENFKHFLHENLGKHSEVSCMTRESILKSKLNSSDRHEISPSRKCDVENNAETHAYNIKEEDITENKILHSEDVQQEPYEYECKPSECVYIKTEDTDDNVNEVIYEDNLSGSSSNLSFNRLIEDCIPGAGKGNEVLGEKESDVLIKDEYERKCESNKRRQQLCKTNLQVGTNRVQELNKKYKYNVCSSLFSAKPYLQKHIDTVHEGKYKTKYVCNACHKVLSSIKSLKLHIDRVHKGVNKTECDVCRKMFFSKQNLQRHIDSVHKGRKRFDCNECHHFFTSKWALQAHIYTVHIGIKENKCTVCHKMFAHKCGLKEHIQKIHGGVKYECNLCQKLLSTKRHLRVHIKNVHEGTHKVKNRNETSQYAS